MSARIGMVRAGEVKVGQVIDGYTVTGFGQGWTLSDEENCAWGAEPGARVRVCYAYGERVAAPAPAPVASGTPAAPAAPAYGSPEWTTARIAQLAKLIDAAEHKADCNRRSANVNHQALGIEAAELATTLRAQLATLTAQQATTTVEA